MSPVTSTNENKLAQSPPQSQLKMTDIKPELITKAVRKHAGRAKERFLQNLGKADRTTDEVFDDYVHNFTRQQNQSVRLQKEVANYIRCTRAMQAASKSLMDTVYDMYEPDWVERDRLAEQALVLENVWSDYSQKLRARVDEPVEMYASQFPEVRRKVEKRGRKLVDYDSHRHNYEALQNTTKRRDQAKIDRQHQILLEAKQTFESVNSELYDELPALYDSRLPFLVSSMQNLFDIESNFLSGAAKVQQELEILMDRLHKESTSGRYSTRRNSPKSPKSPTAPVPASPTELGAGRSGGVGGGGGLKQTFSNLGKRFSVRQDQRQRRRSRGSSSGSSNGGGGAAGGGGGGLTRAATFHVPHPPADTNPFYIADGDAGGQQGAYRRLPQHRHNPFLDSPGATAAGLAAADVPNGHVSPQLPRRHPRRSASPAVRTSGTPISPSPSPPPPLVSADIGQEVTTPSEHVQVAFVASTTEPSPEYAARSLMPPPLPPTDPPSPCSEEDGDAEPVPVRVCVLAFDDSAGVADAAEVLVVDRSEDSGTVARSAAAAGGTRPYEEIARRNENNTGAAGGNRHSDGAKTNGSSRPSSEQPQQVYDIPVGATRDNLPAGVLYRVKAAYRYQAEDSDELSFEVGEVMDVVEYEDAEDQEEGWLMGVKQDGEQKGMFPANFTRPI